MIKISNKFVIFGAVAAAALVVPGMLGPLMFQEAEARHEGERHTEQSANAFNEARDNLIAVQANVQAQVNDVTVCIITEEC